MSEGMTDEQRRRFGEALLEAIENAPEIPLEEMSDEFLAERARQKREGGPPKAYVEEIGEADNLEPDQFNERNDG